MSAVEKAVEVIEADARRYTEVRGGGRELNVTIDSFVRFLSRHLADAGLLVTDEMRAVLDAAVNWRLVLREAASGRDMQEAAIAAVTAEIVALDAYIETIKEYQ